MIRVAHLGADRRTVVSVSIQPADWSDNGRAVASDTANIGDIFDGQVFAPPAPPPMTKEQWMALAQGEIEKVYDRKRVSLASYYTLLDRMERQGSLTADQKADLAVLDAAQQWEQAVLDVAAKAATTPSIDGSFQWPAPPAGMVELVALS